MIRWNNPSSSIAILKEEFDRLKAKNASFSVRSFARLLGLSPAFLSHVMTGRKKISVKTTLLIAEKLKFKAAERDYFSLLVQFESSGEQVKPIIRSKLETSLLRLGAKRVAAVGAFSRIRWQHLFLLVCVDQKRVFDLKALESFSVLSEMNNSDVKFILNELIDAGLVVKEGSQYRRTDANVVMESDTSNKTLKRIHTEYLSRAAKLIEARTPESRFSVTEFFSIPKADFQEAKNKVEELLDWFSTRSKESEADSVLELSLHLNLSSIKDILGS